MAGDVGSMSLATRLELVVRKAAALLPGDLGHRLAQLLSPASLAIMAGVVAIWAGSHFVGVGEIADVVMLVAGWVTIGSGALAGVRKLIAFAVTTASARSEADLNRAAAYLAEAITTLGFDVVLGLLFKGRPRTTFKTVFNPEYRIPSYREFASVMPKGGPTRMYEAKLIITRAREANTGGTLPDNVARVGRKFYPEGMSSRNAARLVRGTVYHERVHQRLTQALSLLGRPALYARMTAYKRSYILRYAEEAAAEALKLRKTKGPIEGELTALQFPLQSKYGITLAAIGVEAKGILLGPVTVGGLYMNAYAGYIDNGN